jgi:hypothetical protein
MALFSALAGMVVADCMTRATVDKAIKARPIA